jgi:hypothetical protein
MAVPLPRHPGRAVDGEIARRVDRKARTKRWLEPKTRRGLGLRYAADLMKVGKLGSARAGLRCAKCSAPGSW